MIINQPRSGYTLPVFACAAAVAALQYLQQKNQFIQQVSIDLIDPAETVNIPIEHIAMLTENSALAITRSDPGDNLDLTRNTPIWARVEWVNHLPLPLSFQARGDLLSDAIFIQGGEGIGYHEKTGQTAIYRYAKLLLLANLEKLLKPNEKILITFILPEGKQLATRTSNAAFGIVEGLSLLGTTGISQALTVPEQLEHYQAQLQEKATEFDGLVFCIGENGLDLAQKIGIPPQQIVKTANWLGSMLVSAALAGIQSILLLGYHGKLIKLAGGIFHTHHHLADGRLEILTAYCANAGLPTANLQQIFNSTTAEDALQYLRELEVIQGENYVNQVYGAIATAIDHRSQAYIYTHCEKNVKVGSLMFDRKRKIIIRSEIADTILEQICYSNQNHS
ncbi:cobalt-precorrin-5B (C(1))-methyltransferase CbiD [Planktothrix mougeotii]|uniref:Cobalt-precorrin-5B C(1)-methyltransferase n=1 Tax=Planktothrix mougeotii LEGE 06226 TaxID=1828728 RepID=A0ABR9UJB7_9CYAN|nr:cobalt-precorrin-5B (C(1))-methyltransferase CbiD [Planktothrix mougeotii]MBE9146559.1 cobalt-precorrin-5B (C(1))-methyltransferase [Planktothrix mougeotii LEGE 06226]